VKKPEERGLSLHTKDAKRKKVVVRSFAVSSFAFIRGSTPFLFLAVVEPGFWQFSFAPFASFAVENAVSAVPGVANKNGAKAR
jgi:hypothetical protein